MVLQVSTLVTFIWGLPLDFKISNFVCECLLIVNPLEIKVVIVDERGLVQVASR